MIIGHPLLLKRPAAGGDPYFSSVALLVAPPVGAGSVLDYSAAARTVTINGGAALSTAIADPWGGGRPIVALDGTGDFLSCADSSDWDFASGAATIEIWVYMTSLVSGNIYSIVEQCATDSGGSGKSFQMFLYGGDLIFDTTANGSDNIRTNKPHGMSPNAWYHLAATLNGTSVALYKNGVALTGGVSGSHTRPIYVSSQPLRVGARSSSLRGLPGYIGATRITKGVARPASAFMYAAPPPTS